MIILFEKFVDLDINSDVYIKDEYLDNYKELKGIPGRMEYCGVNFFADVIFYLDNDSK